MTNKLDPQVLTDTLKGMKVIAIALLMGPVMFLLVAKFIGPVGLDTGGTIDPPPGGTNSPGEVDLAQLLPLIASGLGLLSLPVAIFMRHRMNKLCIAALAGGDQQTALDHMRQGIILSYALLEGPMLFIAIVVLLYGELMPHGVVFAILLGTGIALFPRESQYQQVDSI